MPSDSLQLVSQFHAKHSSILHHGPSAKPLSHRVGVMLVEQVIKAGGNSQLSQKILGRQRGIGHEGASQGSLEYREPPADFLSLETRKKFLRKQRSDQIDLRQMPGGIAQRLAIKRTVRFLQRVRETPFPSILLLFTQFEFKNFAIQVFHSIENSTPQTGDV